MNPRGFIIYLFFLTCGVIFYACKKDKSVIAEPEPVTETITIKEQIIGKWNLNREYTLDLNVSIDTLGDTINNYIVEVDSSYSNSLLYFYSDSTILIDRHSGAATTGTWYPMPDDFDQTHLFLSIGYYYAPRTYHILSLSSNNLVLEFSSNSTYISTWNGTKTIYKDVHTLEMSK